MPSPDAQPTNPNLLPSPSARPGLTPDVIARLAALRERNARLSARARTLESMIDVWLTQLHRTDPDTPVPGRRSNGSTLNPRPGFRSTP